MLDLALPAPRPEAPRASVRQPPGGLGRGPDPTGLENWARLIDEGTWRRDEVVSGLVESKVPIGSGVTEAACKVLVKQRLCGSGMKWKEPGAAAVLSLRCLTYTTERWSQFWGRIDQYGFPVAA